MQCLFIRTNGLQCKLICKNGLYCWRHKNKKSTKKTSSKKSSAKKVSSKQKPSLKKWIKKKCKNHEPCMEQQCVLPKNYKPSSKTQKNAIIWCIDNCSFCDDAKEMLITKGYEIEERNAQHNKKYLNQLLKMYKLNELTFPKIYVDDTFFETFSAMKTHFQK